MTNPRLHKDVCTKKEPFHCCGVREINGLTHMQYYTPQSDAKDEICVVQQHTPDNGGENQNIPCTCKGRHHLHRTSTKIHWLYHHDRIAHRDTQNDRALSRLRVATWPNLRVFVNEWALECECHPYHVLVLRLWLWFERIRVQKLIWGPDYGRVIYKCLGVRVEESCCPGICKVAVAWCSCFKFTCKSSRTKNTPCGGLQDSDVEAASAAARFITIRNCSMIANTPCSLGIVGFWHAASL